MADATELSKIFRIRKTVAKMLTKRCEMFPSLPLLGFRRALASLGRSPLNARSPGRAESTTWTTRSWR